MLSMLSTHMPMYKQLSHGMLVEEAVRYFHTHSWKDSHSRATRASGMWICCGNRRLYWCKPLCHRRSGTANAVLSVIQQDGVARCRVGWDVTKLLEFFRLFLHSNCFHCKARFESSHMCCSHVFNNSLRCIPYQKVGIAVKVHSC